MAKSDAETINRAIMAVVEARSLWPGRRFIYERPPIVVKNKNPIPEKFTNVNRVLFSSLLLFSTTVVFPKKKN